MSYDNEKTVFADYMEGYMKFIENNVYKTAWSDENK
jgi:hypothetical protein